jgi:hypothetical protein
MTVLPPIPAEVLPTAGGSTVNQGNKETGPPSGGETVDDATGDLHVVNAGEDDDEEQIVEWLRDAMRGKWNFIYYQPQAEPSDHKVLLAAKGFDSSKILRVLLDEEKTPDA